MSRLRDWARRLARSFRRRRSDRDLQDELRAHLELAAEAAERAGHSREAAPRVAAIRHGGLVHALEAQRDQLGIPWLAALTRDVRYALRVLRRRPTFASAAFLVLGLGVGVNVAAFSAVRAVLINEQPYADPARLVELSQTGPRILPTYFSADDLPDIRRGVPALSEVEGSTASGVQSVRGGSFAESSLVYRVTPGFFALFGVPPLLGRAIGAGDFGDTSAVVVLSHSTWFSQFGGESDAVGRTLYVDGQPKTVVGVMPASFRPAASTRHIAGWIPFLPSRSGESLGLYGRLTQAGTTAEADRELDRVMAPKRVAGSFISGSLVERLGDFDAGRLRPSVLLVQTIAGVLLLITCVSLANLFLVRATGRQRELAVRAALGAGRWAIVRQVCVEAGVVAAFGGALGLGVGRALQSLLAALAPSAVLPETTVQLLSVGTPELVICFGAAALTAIVFSVAPVCLGSMTRPEDLIRGGPQPTATRTTPVLRVTLVAAQVFLAVIMLTAAALLINSFVRVLAVSPGFDPRGIVTADITLPPATPFSRDAARDAVQRLSRAIGNRLGTRPFALASYVPYGCCVGTTNWTLRPGGAGPGDATRSAIVRGISPTYFEVLRVALRRGRAFTAGDGFGSAPVAVVNEAFVRAFTNGRDAIGDTVQPAGSTPFLIVGVVADTSDTRLSFVPRAGVYVPLDQWPSTNLGIAVRAEDTPDVGRALRGAASEVGPDASVAEIGALSTKVTGSEDLRRFYLSMLSVFGGLAVLLAAVGVHGVTAHAIALRTREIGIRLALGAGPWRVTRLLVGQGLLAVWGGLGCGLVAAWWLTRALESTTVFRQYTAQLFHITAHDPWTLVGVSGVILLVGAAACLCPARRASRLQPAIVLRNE